ncbi:DNA segregation ATPase FtsK/SpoIIIE, S-DNA-T family [Pseudoxanthobacter soli DSM 19599]|uniref:DNA translocase FtsK n=1 Tax=Pseudoxanthobacter soli DSM 19599 TaxID=1123029 RepID=A0A1M7ZGZ9_9HYPH|nr:DNA segregation ATPase FtsK/SpoIIIE, S-DNA-T family [Pseudoxanthobacter soli DSM 19599]
MSKARHFTPDDHYDARLDARPSVLGFLRRNIVALSGLAILAGVVASVVALATWSVDDPSLSHAIDGPTHNLLGFAGASLADFLIQMFGLGVVAFLALPVLWGLRMVRGRPSRVRRGRLAAWLVGVLIVSAALGALVPPPTWPLPTGLGGALGDMVLRGPSLVLRSLLGASEAGVGIALAVPAALVLIYAAGYPAPAPRRRPVAVSGRGFGDEGDDEPGRFATLLGVFAHWRLSLGAWFHRMGEKRRMKRRLKEADDDEIGIDWSAESARPSARRRGEPEMRREPGFGPNGEWLDDPAAAETAQGPDGEPGDDWNNTEDGWSGGWDATAGPDQDADGEEPPFDIDGPEATDAALPPAGSPRPPISRANHRIAGQPMPAAASSRITPPAPPPRASKRAAREQQPSFLKDGPFELPAVHLLAEPRVTGRGPGLDKAALENNARTLEGVLEDFGVRGQIVNVRPGPVVTLYELEPAPGIKSSRVIGLADDIARSMSAISARVAVIPGKNAIGIELPNQRRETVYLRELLASAEFDATKQKLALCLGKTIGGEPVIADLARMPHLLVAGTTGSGKSVAINTMILSLLYRMAPEQLRLIMVDPKMLELSVYDGVPHLLTPVVTDPRKAVVALKWTVREMEERYRKMSKLGVRNVDGFNARVADAKAKGETLVRTVQTGFDRDTGEPVFEKEQIAHDPMPYIVVIVDEMADLMMVAGKDIEGAIQRLAQMARAAGIHIIMATQRPSVDVITGTIKANFPTRISFQVTSKIDSRTILGEQGAEQLLGQGDMLFMAGGGRIQRVHGPFVSDEEVEQVVSHLKSQGAPDYLDQITAGDDEDSEDGGAGGGSMEGLEDSADLYDRAVAVVLRDRKASTSYVQRRLQIGYNRAASIIERMEREGIVGPANHAGKRAILVGGDDSAAA